MIRTQVASGVRQFRAGVKHGRWGFAALLAAAVLAPLAANAQNNLKIGVINVGRLLEQAPQSQAVNDRLKAEFGQRQSTIVAMQQKLQTQQDNYNRDKDVMGQEERDKLERDIRDGQRDLQRLQNEYLEDLNVRKNEEVGKLQRDILQRVQTYASAQKFDLVVADAIYFSSAVDITSAVLEMLKQDKDGDKAAKPTGKSGK